MLALPADPWRESGWILGTEDPGDPVADGEHQVEDGRDHADGGLYT